MPEPDGAVLLATVTLVSEIVAVPRPEFLTPPPLVFALLPLMVTLVRLALEVWVELLSSPPPPVPAPLPLIVLSVMVSSPGFAFEMPPPVLPAELSVTVLFVSVRLPLLEMPPPLSAVPLSRTTTFVRLTVSLLPTLMAPPTAVPGLPLRTVRSLRLSIVMLLAAVARSNTRSIPPPSIIVAPAPAPLIVSAALVEQPTLVQVTSRSPVLAASSPAPARLSVYVPAVRVIVSAKVGVPLAVMIASRSEQSTPELQPSGAGSSKRVTV
jgi:hypothetical protein